MIELRLFSLSYVVLRVVVRRVGHGGQPVGVVVDVRRGSLVLIGHRSPPPTVVVPEADRAAVGIGDGGQNGSCCHR